MTKRFSVLGTLGGLAAGSAAGLPHTYSPSVLGIAAGGHLSRIFFPGFVARAAVQDVPDHPDWDAMGALAEGLASR